MPEFERNTRGSDYSRWENGSRIVTSALRPAVESFFENRVNKFHIEIENEEIIDVLRQGPHVIVANHPIPEDRISNALGISPDTFILKHALEGVSGRKVHFLGQYGIKASPFIQHFPQGLEERWKRIHKGMLKGFDALAYDTTPNAFLRDLIVDAKKFVDSGESIFIFPYGNSWHTDEQLEERVQRGPAYLARRMNIPILPIYISGARSWSAGEEARVVVGKPFKTDGISDLEVGEKIKRGILDLREESSAVSL